MSGNPNLSEIYFQYIKSLSSLKHSNQFQALDSMELELLNEIGSRVTLHARIKNLRKKDYVDFHTDIDGRIKIIKPTILVMSYFSSIANLLSTAVDKNRNSSVAMA